MRSLATLGIWLIEPLTLRQHIVKVIADPNIALAMLVIGMLLIYLEFNSPGLIVPGVAGTILVLLGLSSLSLLPISWIGAALLLAAGALLVLEARFPAHGMLGMGGTVAMVLGSVKLIESPRPGMRVGWGTAITLAVPFCAITVTLLSLAVRARRNKMDAAR